MLSYARSVHANPSRNSCIDAKTIRELLDIELHKDLNLETKARSYRANRLRLEYLISGYANLDRPNFLCVQTNVNREVYQLLPQEIQEKNKEANDFFDSSAAGSGGTRSPGTQMWDSSTPLLLAFSHSFKNSLNAL